MSKTFDLGEFASPGKSNTRKVSTGQSFQLKFRDDTFTISNAKFEELGLDTKSLKMLISKEDGTVLLTAVGDTEGDMLRRTPKTGLVKGKTFKSTVLEAALAKKGLLDSSIKGANQLLNLEQGSAGDTVVYEIVAGNSTVETTTAAPITGTVNSGQPTSQAPSSEDLLSGAAEPERF